MDSSLSRIVPTAVTPTRVESRQDRKEGESFAGHLGSGKEAPAEEEPEPDRGDRTVAGPDDDEAGARLDVSG